jgi:hypothetical protein
MIDAVSAIKQYDYSGKLIRDIQLPGLGTAGGFSGRKKTKWYIIPLLIIPRQNDIFVGT